MPRNCMILRWLTPRYPKRCCLWCQSTLYTAALEARNLKTAYQVYIIDYHYTAYLLPYHRLLAQTACCQEDTYYYTLLLCHRLVRHALTRPRKNICPGIQILKSSPVLGCVSYPPYYAFTTRWGADKEGRGALDGALLTK